MTRVRCGSADIRSRAGDAAQSRRTMCPEGDFLVKIKFIENRIIDESLVEPNYAEFHE